MQNGFFKTIQDYCDQNSTDPDPLLYELERETYLKTLAPQMLTGHLQALYLQQIIQLAAVKNVLEIGTFTGYTSLAIAQVLPDDGCLDTIEVNKEYAYFHDKYFTEYQEKINVLWGDALTILPGLKNPYDLVYIDAGKMEYATYFKLAIGLLNPGGILLADNVLWSGKVVEQEQDKDTNAMHKFNNTVKQDPRIKSMIILPIRDGLLMAIKNKS